MTVSPAAGLESRLSAFEHAWQSAGEAEMADFLPPRNHPEFAAAVAEAARCDMELRWQAGQPRDADDYIAAYPTVFRDLGLRSELAFEEYRLRAEAGEPVDPADFAERYFIDTTGWPLPDENGVPGLPPPAEGPRSKTAVVRVFNLSPARASRSTEAEPPGLPDVGDHFLDFELVSELGRGTFGRVFLARQGELSSRLVALKVTTFADGEPQKLARLQHTNIVPVYSAHQHGHLHASCMPYLGAVTLRQVIKGLSDHPSGLPASGRALLSTLFGPTPSATSPDGPPSAAPPVPAPPQQPCTATLAMLAKYSHVEAILWIGARLADGLAHAHERGILHRDLKPANILLTDDGQPMLLDFNLAADTVTAPGQQAAKLGGTLPYMAPEQLDAFAGLKHEPVNARADLYALGVILYELLTGRHPFPQPSGPVQSSIVYLREQRRHRPASPRTWNPAVSPAVDAIVGKLLDPSPAARYPSALALRDDLDRQLANLPLLYAPDRSPRERWTKWRRRNPAVATAVAVAAVALVGVVLPVGGVAVAQARLAQKRLAFERADVALKGQAALDAVRTAKLYLSTRTHDRAMLDQGLAAGRCVLDDYAVGTPGWDERLSVRLLPDAARETLRDEFGELLLMMAQAERLRSDPVATLRWNRLAEDCFPADRRPGWLAKQRREAAPDVPAPATQPTPLDDYHDGVALATTGKYVEALAKLLPFTERHPDHFMGWAMRGICLDEAGDRAEAVAAFTVCAALRPDYPHAYFNRGLIRLKQGKHDLAEADFGRALALKPSWWEAFLNRAIAREGRRDWAGADRDLTAALDLPGVPMRAYFFRSRVRKAAGNAAGAAQDADEGLKLKPADALSYVARGVYRWEQDPAAALADFDAALMLDPRCRDALQNRAIVLADDLKRPADAVDTMNRLLEHYPHYVEARAARGVYLARTGDFARARRDAAAVLASEPTPYRQFQMAGLHAQLAKLEPTGPARGDALRLLAEAFRNGFQDYELAKTDGDLDPIRADAAFAAILDHAQALRR